MFKPRFSFFQSVGFGVGAIAVYNEEYWAFLGISLIFAVLNMLGVYLFESDRA